MSGDNEDQNVNLAMVADAPAAPPSMLVWLQTMPLLQYGIAKKLSPFLTSFCIHALLTLLLGMWILPVLREGSDGVLIDAAFASEAETSQQVFETTAFDVSAAAASMSVQSQMATAAENAPPPTRVTPANVRVGKTETAVAPSMHTINHLSDSSLMEDVAVHVATMPMHKYRGETRVTAVAGTGEIASTLDGDLRAIAKDGDAVVVWMLDQSLSMKLDIQVLAQQLVGTLESIEQNQSSKMMHYVVAFGDDVRLIRDSTIKAQAVARSIYALPSDPSGVENTFQAVEWCVDNLFNSFRWWRGRERQKLLVLWTDESGDDYLRLENTIQKCLRANVRVDVIGPSAVLGAQRGYTAFRHPADNNVYQLPVNRGPDSSFPQKLSLGFWHRGVPSNYDESFRGPWQGGNSAFGGSNFDSLLSGFSPYALTRLSRETGGRFTVFDRPADRPPFPLESVRDYFPDYRSIQEIQFNLTRQPLRQIVLASAAETWKSGLARYSQPRLTYGDPSGRMLPLQFQRVELSAKLRPAIAKAYATAQVVERALAYYAAASAQPAFERQPIPDRNDAKAGDDQEEESDKKPDDEVNAETDLTQLERPVNETLLEQLYHAEDSKRWRAWCDLNMGRLLAVSVRLREFLVAANALNNNIQGLNDDTNYVWMNASPELRGGPASIQRAEIAKRLLMRCMEQNPETPWFVMAKQELVLGFGLQMGQRYIPPPVPVKVSAPTRRAPPRPVLPNL